MRKGDNNCNRKSEKGTGYSEHVLKKDKDHVLHAGDGGVNGYSPPISDDGREKVLIGLAIDEAERQIREGRASSQILSHYLRLGTTRERLEKEKLEREIEMLQAKTKALESAKRVEELYSDALSAMRDYAGTVNDSDYD